jgi:CheY-like chemotaxis protein
MGKVMTMTSGPNVLVVDDDRPTREFVVEVLRDDGYQVRSAKDAVEALAVFEEEHLDVVLLDLRMPGIDGADLFGLLTERGLATMPIILMTADNHAIQRLTSQGVKFLLLKPFDLDTLCNCITEALRSPQRTQVQGLPVAAMSSTPQAADVHICT